MITIEADNMSITRASKTVVNDLSFAVNKGEIFGLLGGNGAGKSSTLLAFLGLLNTTQGSAKINGVKVTASAEEVRRSIAYLPESANLYLHLSARENIRYFLSLAKIDRSSKDIEDALAQVDLATEARNQRLSSYSKGMRQKVAIAIAVLRESPIFFLDEPTSGLDPVAIDEFNHLVKSLADQGTTVLMVTHDVYGACQLANRIGLLKQGNLVGMFEAPNEGQISVDEVHQAFTRGA
ncbi:MAG: ABC transporter ATP-binding protein [Acidiferrobacterales bacterium]|nr:ABC transporter ATP-binding protein [Acidiferrobacterales bacterium]